MTERDQGTERRSLPARVWRSIFRGPVVPRTDQERKWVVFNTLVLHLRPIRVPASTLRFTHTFGLGRSCLVLFLLLAATGLLMVFLYVLSPERAYDSVVGLEDDVPLGSLVRGMHYWSTNLLVVFAGPHMLRVFLTGGFQGPRQFNWIVGLCSPPGTSGGAPAMRPPSTSAAMSCRLPRRAPSTCSRSGSRTAS
ncbi:MAG: hypothetical protein ACYS0K_11095 [Planctomycetota bacterium]|jgi:hypothetical protein